MTRTPLTAAGCRAPPGVPSFAHAARRLRPGRVLRPLPSRSGTSSARPTWRAGRWPSSSPWPTMQTRPPLNYPPGLRGVARPSACCGPRIARLYEGLDPDDILVFSGAEECSPPQRPPGPGRSRDRDLARLPESPRGRPRGPRRVTLHRPAPRPTAGPSTSSAWSPRSAPRDPGPWWSTPRTIRRGCSNPPSGRPSRSVPGRRVSGLVADEVYRFLEHDGRHPGGGGRAGPDLRLDRGPLQVLRPGATPIGSARLAQPGGSPAAAPPCKDYTTICAAPSVILGIVALRPARSSSPARGPWSARTWPPASISSSSPSDPRSRDVGPAGRRVGRLPNSLGAGLGRLIASPPTSSRPKLQMLFLPGSAFGAPATACGWD